jgi:hypothetical protein
VTVRQASAIAMSAVAETRPRPGNQLNFCLIRALTAPMSALP